MTDTERATLGDYTVSRIIKGGWQLAAGHGSSALERSATIADMFAFVDAGITTFDCADIYTGVEELIGEFLTMLPVSGNGSPSDVRVHTKFVPDLDALASLRATDVAAVIDRSRERLRMDVLDLVQFHWWDYAVPRYVETALHLERLRRSGAIRQIGVTNFDTRRLRELLDAGVPVVSNQVQYSLIDRRPAGGMSSLCAERAVSLLAYGTLAGGFLSERWLGAPTPATPLENRSLVKYRLMIDEFGGWELFQELLRVLATVAAKHATRIGSVAIRWTLDQPAVTAAIVGARHAGHLPDTRAALGLRLTDDDRAAIDNVLALSREISGEPYELERDREGTHGRIMRYNLNALPAPHSTA
jgi:aryl-alcohol dehydrogenase-like predicted oxidoreductase